MRPAAVVAYQGIGDYCDLLIGRGQEGVEKILKGLPMAIDKHHLDALQHQVDTAKKYENSRTPAVVYVQVSVMADVLDELRALRALMAVEA